MSESAQPALPLDQILDPARLRRVWTKAAGSAARDALEPATPREPLSVAEPLPRPAVASVEPPRPAVTPAESLAAFGQLEAEVAQLFPVGSKARRVLDTLLAQRRAELEQAVIAAAAVGAVPAKIAAQLTAGLDALEDLLEAFMADARWPKENALR